MAARPESLSLGGQRCVTNRRPPRLALAGILPGKSVSRCGLIGSCPSERSRSASIPLPTCRPFPPPHRAPGRAARHPGAHSVRHRVALAAPEGQGRDVRYARYSKARCLDWPTTAGRRYKCCAATAVINDPSQRPAQGDCDQSAWPGSLAHG